MPEQSQEADAEHGYTPNFDLSRHDVIHEDNWAEYQARGFEPVSSACEDGQPLYSKLKSAQLTYGVTNVYTGDNYDDETKRPLRHKPGLSIYVSAEGIEYAKVQAAELEKWMREHGYGDDHASDDPATN